MRREIHVFLAFFCLIAIGSASAAVDKDNLDEYGRGIISNYSDMNPMGEIEYAWVKPGIKLANYRYKLESFENLTVTVDPDMLDAFKTILPKQLDRAGSRDANAPTLNIKGAVYWIERANMAKAWNPFGGMHRAQAGVGIELIFTDAAGNVVAKIRQSGREGEQLKSAALSLCDDIAQFVRAE